MNIQEALAKLLKFIGAVQSAKDEESAGGSKITLTEYPGLAISAVGLVPVFGAIKEVGESVKNMTDEEKQDLVDQFIEEFDIEDDEAEAKIERLFEWVVETSDMVFDLKEISVVFSESNPPHGGGGSGE